MSGSIFWYDYETTGIDPRADRIMQVAGVRTDEALNELGEPFSCYVKLDADILPHPAAVQVTGIGPQVLDSQGVAESEMLARLRALLMQPNTCLAGYNNLRFDDEMTRYALYRNFYDPYAHEWQNGNSRWDLIDALRCAHALRPEGIEWPRNEQGRTSFRLELLTAANGIDHGQAHDAVADVRATIAMARLLRQAQPKLYDFLYAGRSKHVARDRLKAGQPVVHVSGHLSGQRAHMTVVMLLAMHPQNPNAAIVCDLLSDVTPLQELNAEQIRQRLYTPRDQLQPDELPIGLKLVHLNRCPVLAPINVLREQDCERLQINSQDWLASIHRLQAGWTQLQDKLSAIYAPGEFAETDDPEKWLYRGFMSRVDRQTAERVILAGPDELAAMVTPFTEPGLNDLLFRYRGRNCAQSLSALEQQQWRDFCVQRLTDKAAGAPLTVQEFVQACHEQAAKGVVVPELQAWQQWLHERLLELDIELPSAL